MEGNAKFRGVSSSSNVPRFQRKLESQMRISAPRERVVATFRRHVTLRQRSQRTIKIRQETGEILASAGLHIREDLFAVILHGWFGDFEAFCFQAPEGSTIW